jgi:hypothetical protein
MFHQVAIFLDDDGLVAPLKGRADPAVSPIEALGIDSVELAQPLSKAGIGISIDRW